MTDNSRRLSWLNGPLRDAIEHRLIDLAERLKAPVGAGAEVAGGARRCFAIGAGSAAAGLAIGAILLFAMPPLPGEAMGALCFVASARFALLVLLVATASEIVLPRAAPAWIALLPGAGVIMFALSIYIVWRTAPTTGSLLGGLLPWSDASDYYAGAVALANGALINQFNMRRPLNVVLLALKLRLAGGDLMIAVALGAAIVVLPLLLAAREVCRNLGIGPAMAFFIPVAAFIAPLLPTTLSEPHGMLLSVLGFACLWRAALAPSLSAYGIGVLLLALATSTRSGPMFLLPAIVLWGAICVEAGRRWSWRALATGAIACAVGILVPLVLNGLFGSGTGAFQANFSFVLYGIAVGGRDWTQLYTDHPELLDPNIYTEAQRSAAVYRLAFHAIMADPRPLVTFYASELSRAFYFLWGLLATELLRLVALVGGIWCIATLRHPLSKLLVLALAGIMLSAPFLMRDGGQRIFTVAVPFLAAFCALGVAFLTRIALAIVRPSRSLLQSAGIEHRQSRALVAGSAAAVIAIVAAPFGLKALGAGLPASPEKGCDDAQVALLYRPNMSGYALRVRQDIDRSDQPTVSWRDFNRDPEFLTINELRPLFRAARAPFDLVILVTRGPGIEPAMWYGISSEVLPRSGEALLCGRPIGTDQTNWTGQFLLIERVERLASKAPS
jgi:hypothetical protein